MNLSNYKHEVVKTKGILFTKYPFFMLNLTKANYFNNLSKYSPITGNT